MFRASCFCLVLLTTLPGILHQTARADEWTNLRGTATVSAKLVGIWNGRAVLRLEDGRQVSVRLNDLNADSRIKAQDQQEEIDRLLRIRVGELTAIATEAAAPAPVSLPSPRPAPNYVPPSDGADLQTALDHLQAQAKAGHFRVFYDALPKSHQAQADQLFQLALRKVDAGNWELFRSTMHRLAELAVTRQRWLFSYPKFAQISESQQSSLLTMASAIRQFGTEENLSLAALQNRPLAESVAKLDEIAAPYLYKVLQDDSMIASLIFSPYQVESGPNGAMMAKSSSPLMGTAQSIAMVQIEGRWVEGTAAADAQAKWDEHKKRLEAIPDQSIRFSSEAEKVLISLSELLSLLENASNRNAFHRALDQATSGLLPALNLWAGVKPGTGYDNYGGYDPSMQQSYDPSMQQSYDPSMQETYNGPPGVPASGPPAP